MTSVLSARTGCTYFKCLCQFCTVALSALHYRSSDIKNDYCQGPWSNCYIRVRARAHNKGCVVYAGVPGSVYAL